VRVGRQADDVKKFRRNESQEDIFKGAKLKNVCRGFLYREGYYADEAEEFERAVDLRKKDDAHTGGGGGEKRKEGRYTKLVR